MTHLHGFDHFCSYLKGLEEHYVIIGGGAASILMTDQELEFRATKDVDLVVIARSKDLNARLLTYINDGGYTSKDATTALPRYYRFKKPTSPSTIPAGHGKNAGETRRCYGDAP